MAPTLPYFTPSGTHADVAITISSDSDSAPIANDKDKDTTLVVLPPSSSPAAPVRPGAGGDEATSRRKRKAHYRLWSLADELKVIAAVAELRRANLGQQPQSSCVLKALDAGGALRRRGVRSRELSQKIYKLKIKFEKAVAKAAANGGRRIRNKRDRRLFAKSMDAWPDLLDQDAAAAAAAAAAVRRRVRF
ncbi:hypothetical protein ACP4OV_016693 [Aristida adscensionis]